MSVTEVPPTAEPAPPAIPTPPFAVSLMDRPRRADHVDQTWNAAVATNTHALPEPPVLLQGDTLTRVARDEDRLTLRPFTKPALLEELSRSCRFYAPDNGGNRREVAAPDYVAAMLLARSPDQLPAALRINRITEVPVFDSEGGIIFEPGYHAGSRTYYSGAIQLQAGAITSSLSGRNFALAVQQARDTIHDLLLDFPFAADADRANAWAMLLEPFVREMIQGETPLYFVHAHTPGSGKGLLARTALGVGCGTLSPQTISRDEDEMRKQLLATLMEGRTVVFFDNVPSPPGLNSASLAAALTSDRWSGRVLGHSRMADVPVRNVWVATGNNLNASAEIARRIVPIFLEPDGDPTQRTQFTHQDLTAYAKAHRADLVSSALILVIDWLRAVGEHETSPHATPVTPTFLASYRSWSSVLGGILEQAGVQGFLGNLTRITDEMAYDVVERGGMLVQLFEISTEAHPTRDWHRFMLGHRPDGSFNAAGQIELPLELQGRPETQQVQALGVWFRDHRGEVMGGHRALREGTDKRPTWRIEQVGAART